MAHRRILPLISKGRGWIWHCQKPKLFISRPVTCGRNTRSVHTASPLMMKLLSVEEIFARKSLQQHLKKVQLEYSECLQAVSSSTASEDRCSEDELRAKRTKISLLAPLIQSIKEMDKKHKELAENEMLLKEEDQALRELAELEKEGCFRDIQQLRAQILDLLIPEESVEMSDLVLEVTAGVGGQEAMLFTAEVFDMYQGFAQYHGWSFDILEHLTSDLGGLRHASASISGPQSYKKMKFEAGVHRVQRVPKTEKQGRMHTSTMTVAVLPQPTEISLTINPKDLRIDTKRASGAGGQHVNTTDSAVRIVHLPTGVVAECQQERSQLKNREKAMKALRAKLYSMKLEEETSKRYNQRKIQVGTKGRSEKIRTYNFPQDRITDHRISITVHDVKSFLLGEDLLEDMNSSLQEFSDQEALMELLEESEQEEQQKP
ncbi:peptide chain release factor 1-like, mitochondrial [Oryzias melastigma]|uniref:Peptide chain release factor 1-like, mitochondrial n=1 Tax=Oryzias melastigma TaxID=30732 RepID=A0A3B3C357_ORYME|nr:peptide chain release factor 1-like, mitochondrial [Oryzias melastigma]